MPPKQPPMLTWYPAATCTTTNMLAALTTAGAPRKLSSTSLLTSDPKAA